MLDANPGRKRLAVKLAVAGVLLAAACTVGTNLAGPLLKSDSQKAQADLAAAPTFTPYTVAPSIINKQDVQTALEKDYPPLLRDAGIGGTVKVMFFIDETGTVQKVLIGDSSGHPPIDEAALKVARAIRFKPAQNRGKDVPVWVTFPITFQVH